MKHRQQSDTMLSVSAPKIERLKVKATEAIPAGYKFNKSTNEGTQQIINAMFLNSLGIKEDPHFRSALYLVYGDHKTVARMLSTRYLHESQETNAFAQYKWLVPVAALFHLQMNLVHLLLMTHFGSEKPSANLDNSHLCQNAEFWNRTKIRPGKFDFHAAEELIIHSYKARVVAMVWIIVRRQDATMRAIHSNRYQVDDELAYLDHWLRNQPASMTLKKVMDEVCVCLMELI